MADERFSHKSEGVALQHAPSIRHFSKLQASILADFHSEGWRRE